MFTAFFFFNDTATTEIYTLSLHDALPICSEAAADPVDAAFWDAVERADLDALNAVLGGAGSSGPGAGELRVDGGESVLPLDRKSTRLNSSHANISYAVFCLKKKKTINIKF